MKKNRRFAIVAFLLVAVIAVGVGFANFTESLRINGTFGVAGADVYFDNAVLKVNGSELQDAEAKSKNYVEIAGDKNTITIVVENALVNTGDKAVITANIVNDSAFDVTLARTINHNYLANFSFDCSLNDTQTLGAGQTLSVTITVELMDVPDADITQTFVIDITATEIVG